MCARVRVRVCFCGCILHPERIFCTDEKGYTSRGMTKPRRVTTYAGRRTATTASGDIDFGHITACGFISMGGASYGPGVVLSGAQVRSVSSFQGAVSIARVGGGWHFMHAFSWSTRYFQRCGPKLCFMQLPKAVTADIFQDFFMKCWLERLDQNRVCQSQAKECVTQDPSLIQVQKILVWNSGGGALLHLNDRIIKLFKKFNVHPHPAKMRRHRMYIRLSSIVAIVWLPVPTVLSCGLLCVRALQRNCEIMVLGGVPPRVPNVGLGLDLLEGFSFADLKHVFAGSAVFVYSRSCSC